MIKMVEISPALSEKGRKGNSIKIVIGGEVWKAD